jgi:hypothetical protein
VTVLNSQNITTKQSLKVQPAVRVTFALEEDKLYYKRSKLICTARVKAQDDEVWQSVDVTDSLMSPFAFAISLSEFEHAASGQVLTSWARELLLVTETHQVPPFEKGAFKKRFIARVRTYGEYHYVVCLLLFA